MAQRVFRPYKRSPWSSIRGFAQFKRNMRQLAKLGDQPTLVKGFTDIAREIKYDMERKLSAVLKSPTQKYLRNKKGKALNLRKRGVVAKPFMSKGKGKSFVGIDYRFAPHAHLIEFGTGPRYIKALRGMKAGYRGTLPKRSGSKTKFAFFRPTINTWRRRGAYVSRVRVVVGEALNVATKGMTV